MKYLMIGKLVNTHGIKGEVRILSDFRYKSYVFKKGFKFYMGDEKEELLVSTYRHHKSFEMVTFDGIYNINDVLKYKGLFVYINKEDLKIEENKVLAIDLIGFNVIINGKSIGTIMKILDTISNEVLVLDNNVMIPYVDEFIIDIIPSKKEVVVRYMKGLL